MLFRRDGTSSSRNRSRNKQTKQKTWTGTFVCLANRKQSKIPKGTEKTVLFRCGLGLRRITANLNFTAEQLFNAIEDIYPKLKGSGGFEFLRCGQNCRDLQVIDCNWCPVELRNNMGSQAKIYLRPVQKDLETSPLHEEVETIQTETCKFCKRNVNLRELRDHIKSCGMYRNFELPDIDPPSPEPLIDRAEPEDTNLSVGVSLDVGTRNEESQIEIDEPEDAIPPLGVSLDVGTRNEEPHISTETDSSSFNAVSIEQQFEQIVEKIIKFCKTNDVVDPVEILRKYQQEMVTGRALEIEDVTQCAEGDTNFILIDRFSLLNTAMDEIGSLSDLRVTLEVQFNNEVALDYGGPRKEFFRLLMQAIKEKYFDNGLRDLLADQYLFVGKIFALSSHQNGKLPTFLESAVVDELFNNTDSNSICITNLRQGMDALGFYTIRTALPSLVFLFQNNTPALTMRGILHVLKAQFSEEGSNAYSFEKLVYWAFVRYLREVGSGRRSAVRLESVLQFVTGATEEPVLGFKIHPSITFYEVETTFLPTANTCISCLGLPRPSYNTGLPEDAELFKTYDYAFTSTFYGLK
ncbi:uncharacterized protein [Mytilus edulis]|uniref:uncharacterized protein n=1 Tax=Mytilus edulis TaxID=6550 RepID=UPI0039F00846